ncbi:MAG: helix-turn-helix domain-containing protein [Acidimicrobiaceae bacterium]|nr:helix-turn-helix domain-containing protein [Acidimicrobiaceae bacterium]
MAQRLSSDERARIEAMRAAGSSVDDVARHLGRHRSTVYRELDRDSGGGGYDARAAQALGRDLEFMGMLFESMALRDQRVYAQALDARVCYYGDDTNLEADAVIEGLDGQWAAVEVKLGGAAATSAAMESLRAVRSRIDTDRRGAPARLIVVTAFGPGYQTDDGIAVVPLTALKP